MTLRLAVLCAAVLLGAGAARAQQTPLPPDRPGLGDGTGITAHRGLLLEAGYAYEAADGAATHAVGQALVRYGAWPGLEARLGIGSLRLDRDDAREARTGDAWVDGTEDLVVGLKARLTAGDGLPMGRPAVSLLAAASLPSGTDDFSAGIVQPELKLLVDWPLAAGLSFSGNAGAASVAAGDGRTAAATVTASLGAPVPVADGLGAFVGYGAFWQDAAGTTDQAVEAGLTYLLGPDVQLDVNGGVWVDASAADFFVGFGVALRP